jgi:alcohol dehydrogenase (cytochrome c)
MSIVHLSATRRRGDAATGEPLWSFPTNQTWRASPTTHMFDGRQFLAMAAGPNIIALAIRD